MISFRQFYRLAWVIFLCIVVIGLLTPDLPDLLKKKGWLEDHQQYVVHSILFGLLYILSVLAWGGRWRMAVYVLGLSFLLELVQLVVGRGFSKWDMLGNLAGVSVGFFVYSVTTIFQKINQTENI